MRGKNITRREEDLIRLLHSKGHSVRSIAHLLGRGKSGIMSRIQRMERENTLHQGVLDMGQADDQS